MTAFADLEIDLDRRDGDSYALGLRYSQPGNEADIRLGQGDTALVRFDVAGLQVLALDPAAYGKLLTENLFVDPAVQSAFAQARSNAETLDVPLRLRLFIGPSAPELHSLRWETLCNPQDGSSLFTGEHILFSRYLSSQDWRPVRLRPQGDLHALVVIANPANLADYGLAPLNVTDELARATTGLGSIQSTALASKGSATLDKLGDELRNGYDILYLVCHGAVIRGEPWLWLEDDAGNVARVAGGELVIRLRELQQRPALVVLASCESGSSGDEPRRGDQGALAALGPRLAEAGIPAVLAMQGNITMQTTAEFMPVFFRELRRDGQIDRAVAVARGTVRDRPDFWMPVLFMRLKSGRIWYVPGFAGDPQGFKKWPALHMSIRQGHCTPILGPGVIETLLGSQREIAQRWAETYHFPLAPHNRDDLPQVAQFLAVNQSSTRFPRGELEEYLCQEILRRYGETLPAQLQSAPLDQLVDAVGAQRRADNPADPHNVLARLPFPIYITTTPDNLLASALKDAGKKPEVVLCPWNEYVAQMHSIFDDEPNYQPDAQRPLVYHLLGQMREPDSIVLTEDDYFDFLIGVTSNKDLIPAKVRRALADTALLFLGFHMDDWNFRVLFHSLIKEEGSGRRSRYPHVAVQIDPEQGRILEPEGARRYLESYFEDVDISIYWGNTEDFVKELQERFFSDSRQAPV